MTITNSLLKTTLMLMYLTKNDFVSMFYGIRPLWTTKLFKGIVVKAENQNDYFIVMECSRLNKLFKKIYIIVTLMCMLKIYTLYKNIYHYASKMFSFVRIYQIIPYMTF